MTIREEMREFPTEVVWHPPNEGIFKINTNAAFNASSAVAKIRVVCRDSSGTVCFCASARKKDVKSPLQAELLSILFGLEITIDKGFKCIQMEIDYLIAVQEIK